MIFDSIRGAGEYHAFSGPHVQALHERRTKDFKIDNVDVSNREHRCGITTGCRGQSTSPNKVDTHT